MEQPENRELFCIFGLLRSRARVPAMIALLPEPERARLQPVIERLQSVPEPKLKQLLTKLRVSAASEIRADVAARLGLSLDRIPERLQWWIVNQRQMAYGREDH